MLVVSFFYLQLLNGLGLEECDLPPSAQCCLGSFGKENSENLMV